ncbi:protealysin inhibitor emfourin [Massilia niastensis]|uniref:protealysin inhibitor emfourin n=1 Tax=Massilia niastensis TaxID=544911 RepID=UPI000364A715|nr:protealysin inhibitor emfourin [Massilia niastensis]
MKISARACGGFAGVAESYDLDTAGRADGAALEALLRRLDFFAAAPSCPLGADLPRWEITVRDGARCHTVFLREDGSGGDWQALLDGLRRSA